MCIFNLPRDFDVLTLVVASFSSVSLDTQTTATCDASPRRRPRSLSRTRSPSSPQRRSTFSALFGTGRRPSARSRLAKRRAWRCQPPLGKAPCRGRGRPCPPKTGEFHFFFSSFLLVLMKVEAFWSRVRDPIYYLPV